MVLAHFPTTSCTRTLTCCGPLTSILLCLSVEILSLLSDSLSSVVLLPNDEVDGNFGILTEASLNMLGKDVDDEEDLIDNGARGSDSFSLNSLHASLDMSSPFVLLAMAFSVQ